jgi:hypothetical protein
MRPRHIDRALETLREVALTHRSTIVAGELLEISHYVARVERQLERAKKPGTWERVRTWWTERWHAGAAARRRVG